MFPRAFLLLVLIAAIMITVSGAEKVSATTDQDEFIPAIIDLADVGFEARTINHIEGRHTTQLPTATVLKKTAPQFAAPDSTVQFEITVANYAAQTHTFWLEETRPADLSYLSGDDALNYDTATRRISWSGRVEAAHLDYRIEPSGFQLPYIDLGAHGLPNHCEHFTADNAHCNDVTMTFNLGSLGYSMTLYGSPQRRLTLSDNGLIFGAPDTVIGAHFRPKMLPSWHAPNFIIAPLWQDINLSNSGRWHSAILQGYIDGHDVFYVQWHDAPHTNQPDLTTRFAIVFVLDGVGEANGQIFFIYDHISNPNLLESEGYTIGIEDRMGARGLTYAYAPCCGDWGIPQGHPPESGTVLQLRPTLLNPDAAFTRTFTYTAKVNAGLDDTIISTVTATSDSACQDPNLSTNLKWTFLLL